MEDDDSLDDDGCVVVMVSGWVYNLLRWSGVSIPGALLDRNY